ncbi:GNAT family N-acetyltransferase [Azospirillum brasilense]|uniref:GNAT family N-acetyltransferase n=1 Tax=Azospirillum brasilense TaxID=192 RepID=UPI000E694288|nr:GNAT family N-acetyltransferase [Azospirillum brasilense]NUB28681.1 GNAT family N-acetyltransferase [Azospirillum brasilense]NUB35754.1 GNAT family N-acetyltransferase [Azospirillum brasilense]RIV96550.1 N-acetyltransferase [Azospirillum brasilense]
MTGAPLPDRLDTARLTLRPFRMEDAERFVPLIGEWEVARWLARVPHPYGLEDGRVWVALAARNRAERASLDLLAVRKDDAQPVGGIGVILADGEIGYWLGRPHQGIGYGTEMLRAIVPAAFALGLPRLWARTAPDNRRSRRVLETVGFTPLDAADHYELTAGRWRFLTQETA